MSEEFKDSDTQDVSKTLLVAVAGTTGSGKTESAMRIATGIAGSNFSVIDSENKRALNKKNRYRFHHLDMQAPYSPEHYHSLIEKSIKAGHKAIVIDSFSAEWDDEGGLSDDANKNLERMSKGDMDKAAALTGLAWKDPKIRHKQLMRYMRKLEIPIIFCLRAEPKIKYIKEYDDKKGREVTKVVDAGWLPIAEKLFGYDMLIYALMMPENPGIPVHLKKLEPEFEPMFPMGKQITEKSGQMLAAWASGAPKAAQQNPEPARAGTGDALPEQSSAGAALITADEALKLEARCTENAIKIPVVKKHFGVERFSQMTGEQLAQAHAMIDSTLEERKRKAPA